MLISKNDIKDIHEALSPKMELTQEEMAAKREALRNQAMKFLMENQETYVAQWILQNPFAQINDYRLKFVYNDQSLLGYTVEMEKIENV